MPSLKSLPEVANSNVRGLFNGKIMRNQGDVSYPADMMPSGTWNQIGSEEKKMNELKMDF